MRLTPLVSAAFVLSMSGPSFAQEWIEFASRQDRFTCNFPSQPTVTESTYRSEFGADLPARVYSATQGQSRYSVTVVDYNHSQGILTARAKACPPGLNDAAEDPALRVRGTGSTMCEARSSMRSWQVLAERCQGDALRVQFRGPRRRTAVAPYQQRRQIPYLRGDLHARKQALRHGRNRAAGLPGAVALSPIPGMARRERDRASLSVDLLERMAGAPPRQPSGSGAGPGSD